MRKGEGELGIQLDCALLFRDQEKSNDLVKARTTPLTNLVWVYTCN